MTEDDKIDEINQRLDNMKHGISRAEERLDAAPTPDLYRNMSSPLWLLSACLVVAVVSVAVFLAVTGLAGNTESIRMNCEQRNEQAQDVNKKFGELSTLIDVISGQTNGVLQDPEVKEAVEVLRQPIPAVECN